MRSKVSCLLCAFFVFSSCLKDDIGTSNQEVFQYVWDELDQQYGGFMARGVNWDSMYTALYPSAVASQTELEIFAICSELIDVLDDQHVSIVSNALDLGFASGKEGDELIAELGFDSVVVRRNYLDQFEKVRIIEGEDLMYGTVQGKNIGYIYIPSFGFDGVSWFEEIDRIISELIDTDGLILDVRNNGGGSPIIDRYMAARFVAEEKVVFTIQTRDGPMHTDFDEPTTYFAKPEGAQQYTKNIVLLINHSTVSAGEEFALFLETQPHVTVVGDTTSNALSTVPFSRLLPNGWEMSIANQLYLYPDGTSPEGVGIVPDFYLRNDSLDIQNGIDEVLEKAIEFL